VEALHADRLNERTLAHVTDWLKGLGAALLKSERHGVAMLDNGPIRLTLEYQSMGALLEALVHIDALRAMVWEDEAASSQDAGGGLQSR
jgi:hypothetical protein